MYLIKKYNQNVLLVPEKNKNANFLGYPHELEIVYIKNPGEFINYHII